MNKQMTIYFLFPATQKVAGYYTIPSEPFECPSGYVRPSALRINAYKIWSKATN